MPYFSLETKKARRECNIFKVQKEKPKTYQPRILYPAKKFLKNEAEIKTFSDERKLSNHCQQPYTINNAKENSLSLREMIIDRPSDSQKGIKNIRNGKYLSKCK